MASDEKVYVVIRGGFPNPDSSDWFGVKVSGWYVEQFGPRTAALKEMADQDLAPGERCRVIERHPRRTGDEKIIGQRVGR